MEQEEDIDFLLLLLKRHSPEAFLAYMNINHNKSKKEVVSLLVKQWVSINRKKLEPEPGPEKPENARLIACTLPFMLEEEVKYCDPKDDNEEAELIGLTPPLEYYLPMKQLDRKSAFFKSLMKYDVLVGKVVEEVDDAYKIHVLSFDCKRKHRYVFDLNIELYYKKGDGVIENMTVGSFVRGVLYDMDLLKRRLYVSFDSALVKQATKLGVITEDELPLHYKMMACNGPVNRLESFHEEEVYYSPSRYEHLMKFMNVDSQRIWSFYPDLRKYKCPNEKKLAHIMEEQKNEFCDKWLKDARVSYIDKDVSKSLNLLTKALSYNPNHIGGLLDRAAVYANAENFPMAIADMEKILKVEPTHEKALEYYNTVLCTYAQEFEKNGDYKNALKCYARLKSVKKYENDPEINRKFMECVLFSKTFFPVTTPLKFIETSNDNTSESVPAQTSPQEEEGQIPDVSSSQVQDKEDSNSSKKRSELREKGRESHRHRRRHSSSKSQKRYHKHHHHRHHEHSRRERRKHSHHESRSSPDDSRSRSPEKRLSSVSSDDTPTGKIRRYEPSNDKALVIISKLLSSQKNKS